MNDRVRELVAKWRLEADAKCPECKLDWELGRHGCHYEPVPAGEDAEQYGQASVNCKAFGIRRRIRELEASLASPNEGERPPWVSLSEWLEAHRITLTPQQLAVVKSYIIMNVLPIAPESVPEPASAPNERRTGSGALVADAPSAQSIAASALSSPPPKAECPAPLDAFEGHEHSTLRRPTVPIESLVPPAECPDEYEKRARTIAATCLHELRQYWENPDPEYGGTEVDLIADPFAAELHRVAAEIRLDEAKWRANHWPPLGAIISVNSLTAWISRRREEQEERINTLQAALESAAGRKI